MPAAMSAELHLTRHDSTLVLTLNDPASRNALSPAVKRLSADAAVLPLATHLDHERDTFITNLNHDNGGEGLTAWREKRPPQFR
ncbi:MAG: hypothetical protein RL260_1740 [Pseudomonadota bacterium]|jgi:enoyl-CoA hydratase/carnithine racemase